MVLLILAFVFMNMCYILIAPGSDDWRYEYNHLPGDSTGFPCVPSTQTHALTIFANKACGLCLHAQNATLAPAEMGKLSQLLFPKFNLSFGE